MWEFDPVRPPKPHSDKRTYQDLAPTGRGMLSSRVLFEAETLLLETAFENLPAVCRLNGARIHRKELPECGDLSRGNLHRRL